MASDPYLLPNGTLRNRLGITDADELNGQEANLTRDRLFDIESKGPPGPFDFERLKATHRHIFRDVYDWAGTVRTTDLYKQEYAGGPYSVFTPASRIGPGAERIFAGLSRPDDLKGLAPEAFALKAADLFAGINALHPFREGNGRTQRAFIEALAREAGHELDFTVVSKERMVEASIQAGKNEPGMMRRMFAEIIDPARTRPLAEAVQFLAGIKEIGGKPFDWNDHYIATTTPGRSYAGRLVGQQGGNFLLRQGGELIVGWTADLPQGARRGESLEFTASDLGPGQARAAEKKTDRQVVLETVAQAVMDERIADPQVRERVMEKIRTELDRRVQAGQALPAVPVYDHKAPSAQPAPRQEPPQERTRTRDVDPER